MLPTLSRCKLDEASTLSKLGLFWLNPLLRLGFKKSLDLKDLEIWGTISSHNAERHSCAFHKAYTDSKRKSYPILRALFRIYGGEFVMCTLIQFISRLCVLATPLMLRGVIQNITTVDQPVWIGFTYLAGMIFAQANMSLFNNTYFLNVHRTTSRACGALTMSIYLKSLRSSFSDQTTGKTVNLMSHDIYAIEQLLMYSHYLWLSPLMIIATLSVLYVYIGSATIAAAVCVVSSYPIEVCLGRLIGKNKQKQVGHTDRRINVMIELIQGIRIIKMYAWEHAMVPTELTYIISFYMKLQVFCVLCRRKGSRKHDPWSWVHCGRASFSKSLS